MKVAHPVLALCVYLGIGFLLWAYGLHDATYALVCLTSGVVLYSFLSSLLPGR